MMLSETKSALLTKLRRAASPPMAAIPRQRTMVVDDLQMAMWFADRLRPGTAMHNLAIGLEMTGPLRADALYGALTEILRRHQPLRTAFHPAPEGVRLELLRPEPLLDEDGTAQELVTVPIDLTRGPARFRLVKTGPDRHMLALVCHHVAFDGWSLGIFIRELSEFYSGRPVLPPSVRYTDCAAWRRRRAEGARARASLEFWTRELAGDLPGLDLPQSGPRPPRPTFAGATVRFAIPREIEGRLRTFAREERVSLFAPLVAAYHRLLGPAIIGTPVANRPLPEMEDVIGAFINVVCLRLRDDGCFGFRALTHHAAEVILTAIAHGEVPFGRVVAAVNPLRDLRRSPLFQAMIVLQNARLPEPALDGLCTEIVPLDTGTAKYDLTLYIDERGGRLCGALEFNTDVFDRGLIADMAARFITLLAEGLAED